MGCIGSLLDDDGEGGGGLRGVDPGVMMALGVAGWLGAGVAGVAPGGRVGWAGVVAGVRATEAYDRGGLPGWAVGVMRAGVVGVGGGGYRDRWRLMRERGSCRRGRWFEFGSPGVRQGGGRRSIWCAWGIR